MLGWCRGPGLHRSRHGILTPNGSIMNFGGAVGGIVGIYLSVPIIAGDGNKFQQPRHKPQTLPRGTRGGDLQSAMGNSRRLYSVRPRKIYLDDLSSEFLQ